MPTHYLTVHPGRPEMPDNDRATHQRARSAILDEDFDDVLARWMEGYVSQEILDSWGNPDTSNNPLVAYVSQLTTPGRYCRRPILFHPSSSADGLLEPGGALDTAGWLTKAQTYERRTVGLGDFFVMVDAPDGDLALQLIEPSDIYLQADPQRPDQARQLWHLRLRRDTYQDRWIWTFTKYDLGHEDKPPSLTVCSATDKDETGAYKDLSVEYLGGALEGDAYPYRYEDGTPFIPFVQYKSPDNGRQWHWSELRGLHRGTLHVCTYATYTGRAALDATGSHVLTWNLQLPGADVRAGGAEQYGDSIGYSSSAPPIEQVPITPGAISACQIVEPGVQPGVSVVGPGINLDPLHRFTRGYIHDLMLNRGLGQASVEKVSANPASGAALHISDRQRREYAERTEPLFRSGDLELFSKCAAVLNRQTGSDLPESGYSIVYHRSQRSPQEERDQRVRDEWLVANGYRSRVDVFKERYPGLSSDDAISDLRRIAREEAIVASGAVDEKSAEAVQELQAAVESLQAMPMEHAESADALASIVEALGLLGAPLHGAEAYRQTEIPAQLRGNAPAEEGPEAADLAPADPVAEQVSALALNGAQVTAAQGIVEATANGRLPRSSALAMLTAFFAMPEEQADAVLGSVGEGFKPDPAE
jgi:hypothetical protein